MAFKVFKNLSDRRAKLQGKGSDLGAVLSAGGAAGDQTATGVRYLTDRIVSVLAWKNDGTDVKNVSSEFAIKADDKVNNTGGTDLTGYFIVTTFIRTK